MRVWKLVSLEPKLLQLESAYRKSKSFFWRKQSYGVFLKNLLNEDKQLSYEVKTRNHCC